MSGPLEDGRDLAGAGRPLDRFMFVLSVKVGGDMLLRATHSLTAYWQGHREQLQGLSSYKGSLHMHL